jgi:hypothetical protein
MRFLHFCGGDKGGVGKTFFAKFLINYYESLNMPLVVYETDRSNQDIFRAYFRTDQHEGLVKIKTAFFSDNPVLRDAPDAILYDALDGGTDIVVNLPAGAGLYFFDWWEGTGAGELLRSKDVKAVYWFLLASEQVERLQKFVIRSDIATVIVCNLYIQPEWKSIIDLIKQKLSEIGGVDVEALKIIELPYLSSSVANSLAQRRRSVRSALRGEDGGSLKLLELKRLEVYTNTFADLVRSTGYVPMGESHHHQG